MARSKESVRQNKAMQQILRGETPEKRVIVGYDKKQKSNHGDKIDRLSDIMKEARMPWFCPKCDKVMKHNLDNKSCASGEHLANASDVAIIVYCGCFNIHRHAASDAKSSISSSVGVPNTLIIFPI